MWRSSCVHVTEIDGHLASDSVIPRRLSSTRPHQRKKSSAKLIDEFTSACAKPLTHTAARMNVPINKRRQAALLNPSGAGGNAK
jgi:hypothetical protein